MANLKSKSFSFSKIPLKELTKEQLHDQHNAVKQAEEKIQEYGGGSVNDNKELLNMSSQFTEKMKEVEKERPILYKLITTKNEKMTVEKLKKSDGEKQKNIENKQQGDPQQDSKQKQDDEESDTGSGSALKNYLNQLENDGKGDMSVVTKALESFLENTLKQANLNRGKTFKSMTYNLVSFLNRQSKECSIMWDEYKQLYNSNNKEDELVKQKEDFLQKHKQQIFKCIETNKMGDIFHLLDNHNEHVENVVSKASTSSQTDGPSTQTEGTSTQTEGPSTQTEGPSNQIQEEVVTPAAAAKSATAHAAAALSQVTSAASIAAASTTNSSNDVNNVAAVAAKVTNTLASAAAVAAASTTN